jgi:aminoglycoside phosphotransferase family enzyme
MPVVATTPNGPIAEPGFDAKLAFLAQPAHYPEPTTRVEPVETHLSWVFLTDRHAYKLKKPVRSPNGDLRTVSARQWNCVEEVRRLPADRMLDRRIRAAAVGDADIDAIVVKLWEFYRACSPVGVLGDEYRRQFREDVEANRVELSKPQYGLPRAMVDAASAAQLAVLADNGGLLDTRARDGRIVEGHGDLRPEHICLEAPPQIIDCLEFSRVLRTLDIVDELGFLALECERLGAPQLRRTILDCYRACSGDSPQDTLVHFYQSHRACVRANLAVRHLREPTHNATAWQARAMEYLELALAHAERARGVRRVDAG